MREMQELGAEPREGKGKGHAFRTRQKGQVPGIVYGGNEAPEPITVDYRELERHAGKGTFLTTPFMLKMAGRATRVIPRAVQTDPVSDRPVPCPRNGASNRSSVRPLASNSFSRTSPGSRRSCCSQAGIHSGNIATKRWPQA